MSSRPRTLQKRMLKKLGYFRNKATGMICDNNGDPVGKHWPTSVTEKTGA